MTNARVVALRPALEVGAGAGAERSRMRPQQPVRVPGAAAGAPGGGRLFREIVSRAVKAGLLTKRAVQVMDSSPMLGAAAVQDTYKLIRTALHKRPDRSEPGGCGRDRPGRGARSPPLRLRERRQ